MESIAKIVYGISVVLFLYQSLFNWRHVHWDTYFTTLCIGTFSLVIIELLHRIINILEKKDDKDDK